MGPSVFGEAKNDYSQGYVEERGEDGVPRPYLGEVMGSKPAIIIML